MTRRQHRDGAAPSATRVSRRGVLGALAVGAAGIAGKTSPVRGREQAAGAWLTFQYDRRNTGNARREEGPRDPAGARWGFLDGGSFESTPVVTSDTVYAADADGAVVAVDRATGRRRWQVETNVGAGRMTVTGNSLLVPADSLEARSLEDGSLQWKASVGNPTAVAVMRNWAYVASGTGAYRVSLVDKQVNWTNNRVTRLAPALAVRDDYVYAVGSEYAQVIALDPPSGSRRWLRRIEGGATGAPTAGADRVFVPTDAGLTALSHESGVPDWTADAVAGSSVAYADGTVYATTAEGDVVALDAATGDQQWAQAATTGSNCPVLAGGLLYVTGTDGSIAALNPGDGTVVWETTVGGARPANVAVAGGELYAGDEDGNLAALAAGESGGLQTATPTPTATASPTEPSTEMPEEQTPTPTSTGGPGFGLLAGAAATGIGAWAALRGHAADDAE